MIDFPCTACGLCCKYVGESLNMTSDNPIMQEMLDRFPYKVDEEGKCEKLTEDGKCSVYYDRPLLCNIKKGALLLGIHDIIDVSNHYHMLAAGCNKLITDEGLDESYLVTFDH